jgi:hypothetical protein
MRDCEMSNIPHAPSTGLSGTQFSTLKSARINDPEEPEKYNNTESRIYMYVKKDIASYT